MNSVHVRASKIFRGFAALQIAVFIVSSGAGIMTPLTASAAPNIIHVFATKIVCDNESDLPDLGAAPGGPDITASTASDFLSAHPDCHLQDGWSFEWGNQNTTDAGRDFIGHASDYTTFGPTVGGIASTHIPLSALGDGTEFHLREVLQAGYIPFTYDQSNPSDDNAVSAEFYCSDDVLHYDNFDFIRNPAVGETYYCVGWNVRQTGTLHIVKHVVNDNGGTATADDWTMDTTGDNPSSNHFAGSEGGVTVTVGTGAYSVDESGGPSGYEKTLGEGCSGTIGVGEEKTCTITNDDIAPQCNAQASQTIVSDTLTLEGGNPSVLVPTPYNIRWTVSTSSLGAVWIWGEDPVADPVNTTSETFTRTFNIVGTPLGATLDIAADNSYTVTVNGHAVGADATEFNYQSVADDASTNPDSYTIPASDLVTGSNTITFVVTNKAKVNGTVATNPAGLLYKLVVNNNECQTPPPPPVCNPEVNLIDNGGFEAPVQDPNTWSIVLSSNPLLKWLTAWVSPETTGTLGLEVERLNAYVNHSGNQHAELDGDHPVTTWQNVPTIPGTTYQLSFWHAARADSPSVAADNTMDVLVDGSVVRSVSGDTVAAPGTNNGYVHYTNTFVASGATTKIEFKDTGTDNSYGNFIDDVSLSCVPLPPPPPPPPTTAHVVATKVVCDNESDLPNWGAGGPTITEDTATDWIYGNDELDIPAHPSCHLVSDWIFQWAPHGTTNTSPGDNGPAAGSPWTSFGPTNGSGVATVDVPATGAGVLTWFREVLKPGYIPFSGWIWNAEDTTPTAEDEVSAEVYCDSDVLNYDNYDWINGAQAGNTYYCVAFNAPVQTPPVDACPDEQTDPGIQTNEEQCEEEDSIPSISPQTSDNGGGGGGGGGGGPVGLFGTTFGGGAVLGAATGPEDCNAYLTANIRFGRQNDSSQVTLLQQFLNNFEANNLAVTGVYDTPSLAAVHAFQTKYLSDIMGPWGASRSTGYVYHTTKKQINKIFCKFTKEFPLSADQEAEIARIKAAGETYTPASGAGAPAGVGADVQITPPAPPTPPKEQKDEDAVIGGTPAEGSSQTASPATAPATQGNWWTNFWSSLFGN